MARAPSPAREARALPRQDNASTQRGGYRITSLRKCSNLKHKSSPDPETAKTAMSCRGLVVARQLILFSLDSMGSAVAFRLGGASIVSTVESHLLLVKELWLAVDEIVHHDDIMLRIIVRPRGNVAGSDPNRRNTGVVKLDAEKGQGSITRRGRNETAE